MISKQIGPDKVLNVYKRRGETPLECLERFRVSHPEYEVSTLSYIGRLDPLASGVLIVLSGKENLDREKYLGLTKEYDLEVLFGVSTDTYDILGLIDSVSHKDMTIMSDAVKEIIKNPSIFSELPYPPFSSKPVEGKSLFQWAKEGRLDEITIPRQKGEISDIKWVSDILRTPEDISADIRKRIEQVKGDFRQKEILEKWDDSFSLPKMKDTDDFMLVKLTVTCTSGSYMRGLAHKLGELVGVPALAYSIHRTRVGECSVEDSLI